MNFSSNFKKYISKIPILPQKRSELFIFLSFIIFYFSYSSYITFNSSILDNPDVWIDRYFSFDNPSIYFLGVENIEGHPLLLLFTYPILMIGKIFIVLFGTIQAKTIFITLLCCYMISSSIVYVYRYLWEIIQINIKVSILISIFYGFFFTNLILCFTFESFTFSTYLLSFSVYYYSSKIKKGEKVSLISTLLLSLSLGGVTITNFVKGIIPLFFTKNRLSSKLRNIFVSGFIFGIVLITIELKFDIIEKIQWRYSEYSQEQPAHITDSSALYENIIDSFLGIPILFSDIKTIPSPIEELNGHLIIIADKYHYAWQYVFIGILFTAVLLSILRNRSNQFVHIICCLWGVDIVLHLILRYGLNDPFIFGGHWIYIIPLLIGWLYKSIPAKYTFAFLSIMSLMGFILITNNLQMIYKYICISAEIFPPL